MQPDCILTRINRVGPVRSFVPSGRWLFAEVLIENIGRNVSVMLINQFEDGVWGRQHRFFDRRIIIKAFSL